MVQLWVNLPSKDKKTKPKYQEITNKMMGRFLLPDGKSYVEVIAGEYNGVKGPVSTFTPMNVFNARLKKDVLVDFSFPSDYNTGFLVVEGSVEINETTVSADKFVLFKGEGENIRVKTNEETLILVLSGEPINERRGTAKIC